MTSSLSVVNACVKQTIYASASIFTASTAILASLFSRYATMGDSAETQD